MEKRPFFRADMAGLGKCCTGGDGRIGVYRVKVISGISVLKDMSEKSRLLISSMIVRDYEHNESRNMG